MSLLLSAILENYRMAHIIMIDPHNEYGRVFGKAAELINIDNLQLPFWLFDFEEAVGILVRGGSVQEQEAQALILKDAITRARRHYAGESHVATTLSVDTPTPFRVSDLIRFINEAMGRLDKPDTSMPYLRLKTRLESAQHRHHRVMAQLVVVDQVLVAQRDPEHPLTHQSPHRVFDQLRRSRRTARNATSVDIANHSKH